VPFSRPSWVLAPAALVFILSYTLFGTFRRLWPIVVLLKWYSISEAYIFSAPSHTHAPSGCMRMTSIWQLNARERKCNA